MQAIYGMGAYAVDYRYGRPSNVTHDWGYGNQSDVPCETGKAERLSLVKSRKYGVSIEGISEVYRYRLASSVKDLVRTS
jgi:hypothetical protein